MTVLRAPSLALAPVGLILRAADHSGADVEPMVRAAQSGDVAAFGQLYRENVGRVYALCVRLLADKTQAELFTQDVFVRAWEGLATYRGESSFATWLRKVAVNVVLSERRAATRRARRVIATEAEVLETAPANRSDDAEIDLERAILRLPEGARTVFVLHAIEGYRHDEIAQLMGVAEGTSRAQYHHARTMLKKELA